MDISHARSLAWPHLSPPPGWSWARPKFTANTALTSWTCWQRIRQQVWDLKQMACDLCLAPDPIPGPCRWGRGGRLCAGRALRSNSISGVKRPHPQPGLFLSVQHVGLTGRPHQQPSHTRAWGPQAPATRRPGTRRHEGGPPSAPSLPLLLLPRCPLDTESCWLPSGTPEVAERRKRNAGPGRGRTDRHHFIQNTTELTQWPSL